MSKTKLTFGKSKKEEYKKLYINAYNDNITGSISEVEYVYRLQTLNMKGFKTYHIDNFMLLTDKLHDNGLYDSFNISMLMHMRDLVYNKIADIALIFPDIGNIFAIKKHKMINRINNIQKLLKNKLKCIDAFKRIDNVIFTNSVKFNDFNEFDDIDDIDDIDELDDYDIESRVLNDNINYKNQESDLAFYIKKDIIERLHLLVQIHYTIEQLKFMNIKLKLASEIMNMSHEKLRNYYVYVVSTIECIIIRWINTCNEYINVEINYVECCDNMINELPTELTISLVMFFGDGIL